LVSRWYVLCSKPNKEEILYAQLQSRGYEIFYPRYYTSTTKTGKLNLKSYFPGYLFIRLDFNRDSLSTFQWMPNTEGLVSFGYKPAFVPDTLIDAIQRHVQKLSAERENDTSVMAYKSRSHANRDERKNGFDTIFDRGLSDDERVRELLRMLQGNSLSPAISE